MISANVRSALELLREKLDDPIPARVRRSAGVCGLEFAYRGIHMPESAE